MDNGSQTSAPSSPMTRWLIVLEAFVTEPEWGVRDLAEHVALSRSSVHRIVREMTSLGLLAPAATRGRSLVGPALTALAVGLTDGVDVVRIARPILDDLRDETGETAILALYDPSRRQFRAVVAAESDQPIRYIWEALKGWRDLHLGASGKGILAFLPAHEQEEILAGLPNRSAGTNVVTKAELRRELGRARQQGWVVSHGDRYPGAVGVSAPIRDALGRVVGDVLLGWPDNRSDAAKEERAAQAAVSAARQISQALGHDAATQSEHAR